MRGFHRILESKQTNELKSPPKSSHPQGPDARGPANGIDFSGRDDLIVVARRGDIADAHARLHESNEQILLSRAITLARNLRACLAGQARPVWLAPGPRN